MPVVEGPEKSEQNHIQASDTDTWYRKFINRYKCLDRQWSWSSQEAGLLILLFLYSQKNTTNKVARLREEAEQR